MEERPEDANLEPAAVPPTAAGAEHALQNPDEWVTEDQPMTEAQANELRKLCYAAGEPFDGDLSKGATSQRIGALQKKSGRGTRLLLDEQTDG